MIVISGVLAIFSWNAGNRALTPINGILFINMVPVTTFIISGVSGYRVSTLEIIGAVLTITALVSNNLYQRRFLREENNDDGRVASLERRFALLEIRFDTLEKMLLAEQSQRRERLKRLP
jgi:hypothetical protein